MGWAPLLCAGPLTTSLRGLWVSGLLPPGNGGPYKRAATLEPTLCFRGLTHNSRAGNPKRLRPNCHSCLRGTLQPAWFLHTGRGPKDPSAMKGRDPRTLASRRHWLLQIVAATATTLGGRMVSSDCTPPSSPWSQRGSGTRSSAPTNVRVRHLCFLAQRRPLRGSGGRMLFAECGPFCALQAC